MKRLEEDKKFLNELISERKVYKDHIFYKIKLGDGEGVMKSYSLFKGVEIIFSEFLNEGTIGARIYGDTDWVEINYCLQGAMEAEFFNNKWLHMMSGDFGIFPKRGRVNKSDFLPELYKGVTIMIYFPEIVDFLNDFLETKEFTKEKILNDLVGDNDFVVKRSDENIDHIFKELYSIPTRFHKHIIKIKIVEILLNLMMDEAPIIQEEVYFPKDVFEKIKGVRAYLLENIDKKITLKELSERFSINVTDLEKAFKNMYGDSIYSYFKKIKLKEGRNYILNTEKNILDIAILCGYNSCSKFSKAFKEEYGITPLKYRKSFK